MTQQEKNDLIQLCEQIRDERAMHANTANRVGGALVSLANMSWEALQGALNAQGAAGNIDLSGYALATHNHDTLYSPLSHNHDGLYSPLGHNHDGRYLKPAEVQHWAKTDDYIEILDGKVHFKLPIYSDGEITAFGASTAAGSGGNGGSGGGYDLPSWVTGTKPKVSYWENDAGYITSAALAPYALKTELPDLSDVDLSAYYTKTEADGRFQPKGNYLTEHQSLDGYATEAWVQGRNYLTSASLAGYVNNLTTTSTSGNYVASISKSGKTLTYTKGTLPTALKNPAALTFGSKSYDGSAAVSITAADLGALTSFTETDPTVPAWAKAATKPAYSWSEITGTVPTWNQNTTGNAATATKLQTKRTIWGADFDGSGNIDNKTIKLNNVNAALLNYGGTQYPNVIMRNDEDSFYFLLTTAGVESVWNSLRPFRIDKGNGEVHIDNGCWIGGSLHVFGTVGDLTFGSGAYLDNLSNIEFYPGNNGAGFGGFLDFHFNRDSSDFTTRIIEDGYGKLSVQFAGNAGSQHEFHIGGDLSILGGKITYENGAFHFHAPIYSDGEISAFGRSGAPTTVAYTDREQTWNAVQYFDDETDFGGSVYFNNRADDINFNLTGGISGTATLASQLPDGCNAAAGVACANTMQDIMDILGYLLYKTR